MILLVYMEPYIHKFQQQATFVPGIYELSAKIDSKYTQFQHHKLTGSRHWRKSNSVSGSTPSSTGVSRKYSGYVMSAQNTFFYLNLWKNNLWFSHFVTSTAILRVREVSLRYNQIFRMKSTRQNWWRSLHVPVPNTVVVTQILFWLAQLSWQTQRSHR